MQNEADANAEEDRVKFELASARNEADNMCYQMEKTISENEDKLSDSDKEPLEAAIAKVREASQGKRCRRHQVGSQGTGAGLACA